MAEVDDAREQQKIAIAERWTLRAKREPLIRRNHDGERDTLLLPHVSDRYGVLLRISSGDEVVFYWADRRLEEASDNDLLNLASSLADAEEVQIERSRAISLNFRRNILDFAIAASASGLIGAMASDVWTRLKGLTIASHGDVQTTLDRDFADHVAQWFINMQYGSADLPAAESSSEETAAELVRSAVLTPTPEALRAAEMLQVERLRAAVPELQLQCISEERVGKDRWTFQYRDQTYVYTISLTGQEDLHPIVGWLKRELLRPPEPPGTD